MSCRAVAYPDFTTVSAPINEKRPTTQHDPTKICTLNDGELPTSSPSMAADGQAPSRASHRCVLSGSL